MTKSGSLYCGSSGLLLPVPNKTHYPPAFRDKSRLAYYGSLFNSIEVNSSFYKIPKKETVAKWAEMVPSGFRFTFKLFKELTQRKGLVYDPADLEKFLFAVSGIGRKKGCILIQLPGGTKFDCYGQLEALLAAFAANELSKGWTVAIEFRDQSWYIAETWELLNEFKAALVYQDITKSVTPRVQVKSKTSYFRFHGPTGNYRGSYSPERLAADGNTIKVLLEQGKMVYAYFNNTLGQAMDNLQSLYKTVTN